MLGRRVGLMRLWLNLKRVMYEVLRERSPLEKRFGMGICRCMHEIKTLYV